MKKTVKATILKVLIATLLITLQSQAQTPPVSGEVRKFKDLLKHIPSKDFLKLRGNTKSEAAMKMSKEIMAKKLREME